MSSYLPFQSESEYPSDHELNNELKNELNNQLQIGSYCYCENNAFAVVINISFDECIIFDLFTRHSKTVKLKSLTLITKSVDIEKAKRMHQKCSNKQNNTNKAMEMISDKSMASNDEKLRIKNAQKRFCGANCCVHWTNCVCFTLFLILSGFSIWFLNYGIPLVVHGNAFQETLIKSKCYLMNYDIIDCSYDCWKCDDIARCNKCSGPFCSECRAGAYKYYATSIFCGDNIKIESQIEYGDCPQQGDELLILEMEYDCYIPNNCQYNGRNVFVFNDNDKSISIGQEYINIASIFIGIACLCLLIIIAIKCRKCIKNLPCMN